MTFIKIYIVTYKNDKALNLNLESLSKSLIPLDVKLDINIINNYSKINIDSVYSINIINNELRPDFSTGHLSRNWNQAIINGFKDLNKPDCDILVTCQVDSIFAPNWIEQLLKFHETYSLVTACPGDGFVSYTPEAIKNIGLWDERFCSIEFQEADYFLRALIYNKDYSSINDFHHKKILNQSLQNEHDKNFVYRDGTDYETHAISSQWHNYNFQFMNHKYGKEWMQIWSDDYKSSPPKCKITNYISYPYFEKNILTLTQQSYFNH